MVSLRQMLNRDGDPRSWKSFREIEKWATSFPTIEIGGLLVVGSGYWPMQNLSPTPDVLFESPAEEFDSVKLLTGADCGEMLFVHSHPRGGAVSETDFLAMAKFEEWFGIRRGIVLALNGAGANSEPVVRWELYDKNEILEVVYA